MVSEVASPEVLHDHVEVLTILEGGDHVDDEGVAELLKDGLLVDDWADAFLEEDSGWG